MRRTWASILAGVLLLLAACSAVAAQRPAPAVTAGGYASDFEMSVKAITTPTAIPTPTPMPGQSPDAVVIWWPAPLYPEDNAEALAVLREQTQDYEATQGWAIVIRVKRAEGPGGIFETLQAGSLVAPAAMPDLTLVQHGELAKMVAAKLIQPVDMRALAVDDLFSASTMLGQLQKVQYGIPYVLETQHIAYRSATIPAPPLTLDDLLALRQPYLFPARAVKGVNATFLAQYTAAGGRVADATGAATLDRAPLLEVLDYYEKSVQAEIVTPSLLDYSSASQYWSQFMIGKTALVQVDSTTFLSQRAGGMPSAGPSAVDVSPLPLPAENLLTMIDGWVWVITATDSDRKARALDVVAWFMNVNHQGALAQKLGVLPSRRSALKTWTDDSYVPFIEPLLERNVAPLPDSVNPAIATALQDAFENVLYHRKSSENAADEAMAKIPKTQ